LGRQGECDNYNPSITINEPILTRILIDTGALNCNLISESYLLALPETAKRVMVLQQPQNITAVGGRTITVNRSALVKFVLSNYLTVELELLVVPVLSSDFDVIWGLPAMKELEIIPLITMGKVVICDAYFNLDRKNSLEAVYALEVVDEDELLGDNMFIPSRETASESLASKFDDSLTKEEADLLREKLQPFTDMFLTGKVVYPKSVQTKTECAVPLLEGVNPLKLPPYRYSPASKEYIEETIRELLDNKLIEKSASPWSFPIVVAKRNGKNRFCIDYSKLSALVKKDSYPLPRIDDCLDHLSRARYFTVLDAASGYWQIRVKSSDREILAFCRAADLFGLKPA
jgi:hypothetical protein